MAQTSGKKIIFLGDSITAGSGASRTECAYPNLVVKDGEFGVG